MLKHGVGAILVSCLLVACGLDDQRQGMIAANIHAIEQARMVQSVLAETRECPNTLAGWKRDTDTGPLMTVAGTEKVQYRMRLECREDLAFHITVKYGMDSGTFVSGRDTGPLEVSYGHHTEMRSIEISAEDDASEIATRVVHEPEST